MKAFQIILLFCALYNLVSCTKMDDFTKFIDGKEKIYPATMDSVIVRSGKNRVQIEGVLTVNSGVSAIITYWNNRQDSMRYPLSSLSGNDLIKIMIANLPEGPINLELRSIDADGNLSVPQYLNGNVYGSRYREGLLQRAILSSYFVEDRMLELSLQNVSNSLGFDAIKFDYEDVNGNRIDTVVKTKFQDAKILLPNYQLSKNIAYQTVFRPDTLSIDTFMVSASHIVPKGEITGWFLKNYKVPFFPGEFDGNRWGTLRDWITNDGMKNHNGVGGYSTADGGIVDLEGGWGAPAIIDGKLEQTVRLAAGKYRFYCENGWGTYSDPPVYLVVSAANATIPDFNNIASAKAYARVNSDGVYFEVAETTVFNIGLLAPHISDNIYRLQRFVLELR
jgi:hypothetical protein